MLGVGIAANTVFFSIVNALVLKPLPGADLTGLAVVQRGRAPSLFATEIRHLSEYPTAGLAAIAGSRQDRLRVQTPGRVEHVNGELVTGGYAALLGLRARLGRWIQPADDLSTGGEAVAVISDRLWRTWFDAREDIIGRATLRLSQESGRGWTGTFQIVGVAAADYQGLRGRFSNCDVWLAASAPARFATADRRAAWADHVLLPIARLARGASFPNVERALEARLSTGADGRTRTIATPWRAEPIRLDDAATVLKGNRLPGLSALILVLAPLVLVAAAANLANMLYARSATRTAETAVRLALGASRRHLLSLLFAEVMFIAGLAAVAGLAMAVVAAGRFEDAFPFLIAGRYTNIQLDLSPDFRVVAFAFAVAALAGVIVTAFTALRVMRQPLLSTLVAGGAPMGLTSRHGRLRSILVGVQVTVAVILVMVGGLGWEEMRKTLDRRGVVGRQVHYDTSLISTVQVNLDYHGYEPTRARTFLEGVVDDVRKIPTVEAAAMADVIPGGPAPKSWPWGNTTLFAAEDRDGKPSATHRVNAAYARVSPGLVQTLGLTIRRGRDFTDADVDGGPLVAIVGRKTAATLWPNENAIGQRMVFGTSQWLTIVGLVDDAISADGGAALIESHFVFVPYFQHPKNAMPMRVVVRSRASDGNVEAVRERIRARDTDVAVLEAGFIEDEALNWLKPEQAATMLLISFGVLALGISMLGVYGVIAYFVTTRTREFGIRLALGATRRGVVKLVLDQAIHLTLIGLLVGVFAVSIASRFIQSRQFDFMPNEIETWVVVPIAILLAGVIAGAVPAARAARVSPNVALKDL